MKLVDYETAITLQGLGYDGEYTKHIDDLGYHHSRGGYLVYDWMIPAPRLDDVAYWLRDKYGLNIRISYDMLTECWFSDILNLNTGDYIDEIDDCYEIYNEALEAAVKKALEIISEAGATAHP